MLKEHKEYFETGETRDVNFRIRKLLELKNSIKEHESEIFAALKKDLGKSEFESFETEVGITLSDMSYMVKHLKSWAKVKRLRTPISNFGAKSYIYREPYGTALIIGPFNYPFQLLMEPLAGAIAGGNCAVLKPSSSTPNVNEVISKIIEETFDKKYVRVVSGDRNTITSLINSPFDYIFFTGSVPVGKVIMEAASKNLVPVTLELGGKSPCIVESDADMKVSCQRIAWGKFVNVGQTCIAPDYLLVKRSIKDKFIECLKETIVEFYGEDAKKSPSYGRIVNEKQAKRLADIIDKDRDKVIFGGEYDVKDRYISPTLIDNADDNSVSMQDEIFGPIFPILYYDDIADAVKKIKMRSKPLALYLFTKNKDIQKYVLDNVSFGGGCINDTLTHLESPLMPFGGVGASGMGHYHGKYSFDTFTHEKSIVSKMTLFTPQPVFPPYKKETIKLLRLLLK